jgi:TrmH family RNA methyltransferase
MNKKLLKRDISTFQETQVAEEYRNLNFSIVLIQPEHVANIGSIARVMKNFNFKSLVIFDPFEKVEEIKSYKAQGYAMHGKDVLFNSEILSFKDNKDYLIKYKELMERFDLIIATTAKGKHFRNIRRLSIFPNDLALPISENPLQIALIFGKESHGLTNEEIEVADILLRVPTSNFYPTLNLSHACGIILYEIFKKINFINIGRGEKPVLLANKNEKQVLYDIINKLIEKLKIRTHKKENVFFAFNNVFERAFVSRKEISLILSVFSKLDSLIKKRKLYKN